MLLCLYFYLIAVLDMFDTIDHKFLVSGHSFSQSDRDFAIIEKKCKTAKLAVVDDVAAVIKSARQHRPFSILKMGEKAFFDFSEKAHSIFNTLQLQISKVCWLRVQNTDLTSVSTKTSFHDSEPFRQCKILKRGWTVAKMRQKIMELNAKQDTPSIDKNKLRDFLEPEARDFFTTLIQEQRNL